VTSFAERRWLTAEAAFAIHNEQIAIHGGASGVRDAGLLDSALSKPRNLAAYGDPNVFDLAAAYAFGLARNHPFVDGNKRTAFVCAAAFLRINGHRFGGNQASVVLTIIALAAGDLGEAALADWLRANSRPIGT
jgi:death on curing protein